MRPPPDPLVDPADPAWTAYWDEVAPGLRALGFSPRLPPLVPWTRKAHELLDEAGLLERVDKKIRKFHFDNRRHTPYGEVADHLIY